MREVGFEPTSPRATDFKPAASTSCATPARYYAAPGIRTPTSTDLNRVPLPVGLGRRAFINVDRKPVARRLDQRIESLRSTILTDCWLYRPLVHQADAAYHSSTTRHHH
jgi:hypothetical protein